MELLYAGLDVGTTTTRLVVFRGEPGNAEAVYTMSSPLRVEGEKAWHDGEELVEAVRYLAGKAAGMGVKALGVSVYRASIASWKPGSRGVGRVALWLDYHTRASAWRRASRLAAFKAVARLPVLRRYSSPLSPLPLLISESLERPGWRVWSVDALVSEALTGRYATEPVNAGLLAAFNPLIGRPSRLYRLLGYRGEPPQLARHDEELGSLGKTRVAGLIADQQAAFLGSGCLGDRCASLVMGTGFFAQVAVNPWKSIGSSLAIPIPCLVASGSYTGCIEVMGPGMGITLREAAFLAGGYRELEEVARSGCPLRETGVMIPYVPAAPVKPWLPRILLQPSPSLATKRGLLCAMVGGLVAGLAALLEETARLSGVKVFRAVGGAAKASWLLEAAARLSGATVEAYPGFEAGAAGAAMLASLALGDSSLRDLKDFSPGEPEAVYEGEGSGGVLGDWLAVLRGSPWGLYDALPRLLEKIESSL